MGHDCWEGFVATVATFAVASSPDSNRVFGRLCCCIPMSMNVVLVA